MVVAHYFIDFFKCMDQGKDYTLQETFLFLIFNLIMHHRICWFVPFKVLWVFFCTHAANFKLRASFERRGLKLWRVMMKVWRIDWGRCFSFRSFIRVCGYRVIWLLLKSIIKLLFIAAVKEEVLCRHSRCQMDSLGGWRIIFINRINTAWASAMRIPSNLLPICINHRWNYYAVTKVWAGTVPSLPCWCSPWMLCWGCLQLAAQLAKLTAFGNFTAWRLASFIKKSDDAGTYHYQSLHVWTAFNLAMVFTWHLQYSPSIFVFF